jgi:hypothetical protein
VARLEESLYRTAESKAHYANAETLALRVRRLAKQFCAARETHLAGGSSGSNFGSSFRRGSSSSSSSSGTGGSGGGSGGSSSSAKRKRSAGSSSGSGRSAIDVLAAAAAASADEQEEEEEELQWRTDGSPYVGKTVRRKFWGNWVTGGKITKWVPASADGGESLLSIVLSSTVYCI